MPDELFGYVLHPADIATSKALAAAGRRKPRDVIDLLQVHQQYLPLGAVIWAAVAKDPGFSPEGLIAEIRRMLAICRLIMTACEWKRRSMLEPLQQSLRAALDTADRFVRQMPAGREGLLFLANNQPVQPDPAQLDRYTAHAGRQRGHWPSSPDIERALLERYQPPKP